MGVWQTGQDIVATNNEVNGENIHIEQVGRRWGLKLMHRGVVKAPRQPYGSYRGRCAVQVMAHRGRYLVFKSR